MSEWDLALTVARAVASAGGQTLIVGGWVRDHLLDMPSKDIDLEVYGLPADQLQAILKTFGPVNTVGSSFTVYKLGPLDIALPRTESKTGRGHRGFSVTGNPDLSISDASRRRDFTINAIAWDPLTDKYYDPHNGRRDLNDRRLRMVDPLTFGDDSLRVPFSCLHVSNSKWMLTQSVSADRFLLMIYQRKGFGRNSKNCYCRLNNHPWD